MIRTYLELIRFSHTLFALPFAFLSAIMAYAVNPVSIPVVRYFFGVLLCMVFARSAAMSFNRWADRKIDALNPRTSNRHIPDGRISPGVVLVFTVLCSIAFVASTCMFLPNNPIPVICSIPVLLFLLSYSYAKRWTAGSHFWLGISLMLAPIAAWVAVLPQFSFAPLVLALAVFFWSSGFDIIYATQDHDFDVKMKLHSIPAKFGIVRSLMIAAACHVLTLVLLFVLPMFYPTFGRIYYVGLSIIAIMLVAEHLVIRPSRQNGDGKEINLDRINVSFFYLNAIISTGLLVIGIADIIW